MSDLGWTRLIDLIDVGYQIDRERSALTHLVLEHPANHPTLELHSSGKLHGYGAVLWPMNTLRENTIDVGQDMLFQEFCFRVDQPTPAQERRYHLRLFFGLTRFGALLMRGIASANWHFIEGRR